MDKQIFSKAVGIDLGTTNSAVAVMNQTDCDIIIHKDKNSRRETTPSCVWKDPKSGAVVVGHKAFSRIGTSPTPIRSIKRLMGQQMKVNLTNEEVTPEQVSAYILKEMKRQIEEDMKEFFTDTTEWIVDRAIITVPAYFDQPQIEATRKAGELAGLEVLELLHEPTASACYYCWKNKVQNGVFLVYDLGGGTFDVTVLRCIDGESEVLGISGNRFLGGDDMDKAIAEDLQYRLLKDGYALELDVKNNPEDGLRFDKLKFLAEGVKKALSPLDAGEYYLRDTGSLKDKEGLPVLIEIMYAKPEIEALIRPIVERTIPYCFDALEQAKKEADVNLSDVDAVILAGGPTHIPLVREIVRQHLCSPNSDNVIDERARQPRAKCTEPVYEKVDSIVALGASTRAAASGGIIIYNAAKTIRIRLRGIGVTNSAEIPIGGNVEVLDPCINIEGGYIRLIVHYLNHMDDSQDYMDQVDLQGNGSFAFEDVPLQEKGMSILTFEVYDQMDKLMASVERQLWNSSDSPEPIPVPTIIAKPIHLEVLHDGKPLIKELIPALAMLPISQDFTFSHPGNTEVVILPIYQHKRKIQDIKVKIPLSMPKDTPVELNIRVDKLSRITVMGKIGETRFEALVEPPKDREIPGEQEVEALDKAFSEAIVYLPESKKSVAEARYKKAKMSFEAAAKSGDNNQAISDFEEIEELVAEVSCTSGSMDPSKEVFDELVEKCLYINQDVANVAAEAGRDHDQEEIAKSIEAYRLQGERAYKDGDQKTYSEANYKLESMRTYLIDLYWKIKRPKDNRTDEEIAADYVKSVENKAPGLSQLAAENNREDLQDEIRHILEQLWDLSKETPKNPQKVRQNVSNLDNRLEQIRNMLKNKKSGDNDEGKLVVYYGV